MKLGRFFTIEKLNPTHVSIRMKDKVYKFDYPWLFDHDPKLMNEMTLQKISRPISFEEPKLSIVGNNLVAKWSDHKSIYSKEWLLRHQYTDSSTWKPEFANLPLKFPKNEDYKSVSVDYNQLSTDAGIGEFVKKVYQYGICFVKNTPPTKEATGMLANKITFIRQTHFGGLYELIPDLKHKDTAYTMEPLNLHTDTTYFSDPIKLQLFHILAFDGKGGASTYADGFKAIQKLSARSFELLSKVSVVAYCSGDEGVKIQNRNPVIHTQLGKLNILRWNPDDRKPFDNSVYLQLSALGATMADYYSALKELQVLLNAEKWQIELKPGLAVVYDNHRFLHGRTAFTGHRHVAGAYINGDDFLSRLRVLNK